MRNKILLFFAITISMYSSAQVGIGTSNPDASAALEIQSTSRGLLIPKLSKIQRDAINSPAVGLLLYQTDNNPGFYYYNASNTWIRIGSNNTSNIAANTASITANINDIALKAPLASPTFTGTPSLPTGTTGITQSPANNSTAIATTAYVDNAASTASGVPYTGASGPVNLGAYDLTVNGITIGKSSGGASTKIGYRALESDTGYGNNAFGYDALKNSESANYNNAFGFQALASNTSGGMNTAIGKDALFSNLTGNYNSAFGSNALYYNVSGGYNLALGSSALTMNISARYNVAVGQESLVATNGNNNTALGFRAGNTNTTGTKNTLIGYDSDVASVSLTNATAIGANAIVNASNKIRLGDDNITNIETSGSVTIGAITIPNTDGTVNQILKTDGSGTLSWSTISSGLTEIADEYTSSTGVNSEYLTANKTSFTLTQAPSNNSKVKMYVNGIRISNTAYSWTGTTLTYIPANNGNNSLTTSDRVQFDYFY